MSLDRELEEEAQDEMSGPDKAIRGVGVELEGP